MTLPKRHEFTVLNYSVQISEEIVRWCFEVKVRSPKRFVIFTNPTAGPWKLVKMPFEDGHYELYRFGRDEERPDVIVVCDDLKRIYVIEAKESARELKQVTVDKTIEIAAHFATHFSGITHLDWALRLNYQIAVGFLFGSASRGIAQNEFTRLRSLMPKVMRREFYLCAVIPFENATDVIEAGTAPSLFSKD